jgi:hypothetical protein
MGGWKDEQQRAHGGERRCEAREEEEKPQMTHICEVSPLFYVHPLMMHVNRAMASAISSGDDTIGLVPHHWIHHSQI